MSQLQSTKSSIYRSTMGIMVIWVERDNCGRVAVAKLGGAWRAKSTTSQILCSILCSAFIGSPTFPTLNFVPQFWPLLFSTSLPPFWLFVSLWSNNLHHLIPDRNNKQVCFSTKVHSQLWFFQFPLQFLNHSRTSFSFLAWFVWLSYALLPLKFLSTFSRNIILIFEWIFFF